MSEVKDYEQSLYQKMRYAVIGTNGRGFFPVELLMEWEEARLRVNPNAKPQDLLKYENVQLNGGARNGQRKFA